MTEDARILLTTLTPLGTALISSAGVLGTALFVTTKLDQQRQKMELYKTLYAERIGMAAQSVW
jgi:hypothetical protein